jgi:hypothetical protein
MKIRSVGAKLFNADRQRDRRIDMMKLIVAFQNLINTPKNELLLFPANVLLNLTVILYLM